MIDFALIVAVMVLAVGLTASLVMRRLHSLRLQLLGLALVSVVLPLGAVLLSGALMFNSGHDLTILAVAVAASTTAIVGALLIARPLIERINNLRATSVRIASGDLSARAPDDGPTELAELSASINEMANDIERLFDAKRQLVAWASHDLRTPLASLLAMLEAVEDGIVEPEEYIPSMQQQARVLSKLIDDLFELARIDAGVLTLEIMEIPISAVVDSAIKTVKAEADTRKVRLKSVLDGSHLAAHCAPDKVERVLLNLLTNAMRHTPADGSVAVSVKQQADEICVSVEDTGEGITGGQPQQVFDRFWRSDQSRAKKSGGSGLGLAIAHGLIEAQGGRIWAENCPSGGARFSFTLPAAKEILESM